jgi:iron complex outermembrane recepter protein
MRATSTIGLAIGLTLASTAHAQGDAAQALEEVIVTAQKREQSALDTPVAIAVFDGDALARQGVVQVSEIAHFSPGVHWENINVSKPQVFIRGYGTTAFDAGTDPSIAVFVDEVYVPRFTGMDSDLLDIERVEILKGPQGTLFGRNAAGGAINVITRRPTDAAGLLLQAGYANYNTASLRTSMTGGLNSSGSVRGRLSYSGRSGDGYVDAVGFERDAFDSDRHSIRGQLEFDLGERTLLRLSADYMSVREGMWGMESSGQTIAQKHPTIPIARTPDILGETFNLNGYQRADVWGASVRVEHDFGFATLTSLTGARGDELDELTDFDASAADAIGRQFAEESDSIQQELRLTSSGDSRLTWLAGLYYFSEEVDRLGQFFLGAHNTFVIGLGPFPGNGGIPFSNLDTRTIETDSWAAFGQATFALTDALNITLGGRYTEDEKSMRRSARTIGATDLVNPFLDQAFDVAVDADWNSFDPALIVDYHFNADHMIYASYRQGYKSGGFQTDPVINAAAAGVVFDPEDVRSTELGYKAKTFDGRLQLNLAAHQSTYDNLQFLGTVALGNGGFASLIDNVARAEAKGIELDFEALLARGLTVRASYAYLDSSFERFVSPSGVDLEGAQTNRSPEDTYAVSAQYVVDVGSGSIALQASATHSDDFVFEATNPKPYNVSESYTLYDARLSYESTGGRWRVSLWGKNLTDEAYKTHNLTIVVTPTPLVVAAMDTYARPRTYGLEVAWKYGD